MPRAFCSHSLERPCSFDRRRSCWASTRCPYSVNGRRWSCTQNRRVSLFFSLSALVCKSNALQLVDALHHLDVRRLKINKHNNNNKRPGTCSRSRHTLSKVNSRTQCKCSKLMHLKVLWMSRRKKNQHTISVFCFFFARCISLVMMITKSV